MQEQETARDSLGCKGTMVCAWFSVEPARRVTVSPRLPSVSTGFGSLPGLKDLGKGQKYLLLPMEVPISSRQEVSEGSLCGRLMRSKHQHAGHRLEGDSP